MPYAGAIRILLGLCQGAALVVLANSEKLKAWPAAEPPLFAALLVVAIFVPFVVMSALSYVRPRLLAGWALAVSALCVGTAWYAVYRQATSRAADVSYAPGPDYWFALTVGLFAAHCLFVAGAIDRSRIARYATYFDVSWKFGVQAALAGAFTGAFWLLLMLGVQLFQLINIDLPQKVVQELWFAFPATTIAIACALHVTDVRVGIVRGVRALSCTLLSWLLPLMALIVVCFLATLLFTGLEPLWNTRRAGSILLVAAASLVFLINSAYQDGKRATGDDTVVKPMPRVLHVAMLIASAALVPLTVLAGYAVFLRVQQYGWTPQRVFATAAVIVAGCYAVGYAVAAVRWRSAFAGIEQINIATAFVALLVLVALFTPIADPARISVADQIARLYAGKISPEDFDYEFLRRRAGRFGTAALQELATQGRFPLAAAPSQTQARKHTGPSQPPFAASDRAANLTVVHPPGKTLPQEFIEINWNARTPGYTIPACLKEPRVKCDVLMLDFDGDGTDEIVLVPPGASRAVVIGLDKDKVWNDLGTISNLDCTGVRAALLGGNLSLVPSRLRDIEVAGRRLQMSWTAHCRSGRIETPK
jgi:hypothetical protein